ncbi:MAG TPA: hypothetical protein VE397_04135 [Stellaceae bacterium]|nr:hypothetical protein [Stellaceae bacterium]
MNNLFFYDAAAPDAEVLKALRGAAPEAYLVSTGKGTNLDWERIKGGPVLSAHSSMLPSLLSAEGERERRRTFIIDGDDPVQLSRLLVLFHASRGVDLFAPKTRHYYKNRPVFINSVPKCGTHLLSTCLEAMGFAPPPQDAMPDTDDRFNGGRYYNLQHMRVDDIADQYRSIGTFIDALSKSTIVFVSRDPRDAIISLANYIPRQREYHLLSRFMENMTAEERINAVILGKYPIPVFINSTYCLDDNIAALFDSYQRWQPEWWRNLWRIRYEDLIGPRGLGTREAQRATVWGLQLALHVPGDPGAFAEKVFSERSPTFFKGTIGQHQRDLSAANRAALMTVSPGFIQRAGYADRWQFARSFAVSIEATDRETGEEAARALYGEISARGHGDFEVLLDTEMDRYETKTAVVSVRCRSAAGADEAREAGVRVTVSRAAGSVVRYRCTASVEASSESAKTTEWISGSLATASERIIEVCAAAHLCVAIVGEGVAWTSTTVPQRHGAQGNELAAFSGCLGGDGERTEDAADRGHNGARQPAAAAPARLTQILRLSLGLLS